MRWPELWASASALVAISRPAAAAIDKGLIIIEGWAPSFIGFPLRISSDLCRSWPQCLPRLRQRRDTASRSVPGARSAGESRRTLLPERHGLRTIASPRPRAEPRIGRERHAKKCTRSAPMRLKATLYLTVAAIGIAALLAAAPAQLGAQTAVAIDNDDIGGVVTGANGPEAGVWVIAETSDLPTRYAKMVVTDDQGRYVLPDLPKAKYKVWVRGYGLVDSAKVDSEPGKTLNLRATPAPNAAAAAEYYPAIYWYSMIKVPEKGEFPGTAANGFNPAMKSQGEFLNLVKTNGCVTCHQLGNKATRTIPKALGEFKNGHEAWTRRIQSGQAGLNMVNTMDRMGTQGTLKMFGDWTDRVAKGELPATKPQRPQGIERNAVVTVWDWSNP